MQSISIGYTWAKLNNIIKTHFQLFIIKISVVYTNPPSSIKGIQYNVVSIAND